MGAAVCVCFVTDVYRIYKIYRGQLRYTRGGGIRNPAAFWFSHKKTTCRAIPFRWDALLCMSFYAFVYLSSMW